MLTTGDGIDEYFSMRVLKRLENVPARHHISQRMCLDVQQKLEKTVAEEGGCGMEELLEQLYRGSKVYQATGLADEDENGE